MEASRKKFGSFFVQNYWSVDYSQNTWMIMNAWLLRAVNGLMRIVAMNQHSHGRETLMTTLHMIIHTDTPFTCRSLQYQEYSLKRELFVHEQCIKKRFCHSMMVFFMFATANTIANWCCCSRSRKFDSQIDLTEIPNSALIIKENCQRLNMFQFHIPYLVISRSLGFERYKLKSRLNSEGREEKWCT